MARVDKVRPTAAAGLGATLIGINPKNLLLSAGGAAAIAQTGISGGQQALAYLVFAVIGTLGVGVPVGIYFAMGERSAKVLVRPGRLAAPVRRRSVHPPADDARPNPGGDNRCSAPPAARPRGSRGQRGVGHGKAV
jgi:hypothetical protein